ncbi:MAG: ATP-binding cassette protein [Jatrophihabitantaceae bacterium]|nr:ATP-binding cassette protein [Jatrophihabitantaceae bacterium]
MIQLQDVAVTYAGSEAPALSGVTLSVPEGELCLVIGGTGSGKSTLLGTMNGLVPYFTGGRLSGRVMVAGRDTAHHPPRELADVVGAVGQDARATFVTDTVIDELAYTMESLALPRAVMRRRVEDTMDLLGLADLRDRDLRTLSGGEAQRVAIGAVLAAQPRILVLDEPTSALDPGAAEEVLAILQRLVHDIGLTVVIAEHRLERVVQYADSVIVLAGPGGPVRHCSPGEAMAESDIFPPVVALGRLAGWAPLPLSIRDARRAAPALRARLQDAPAVPPTAPPNRDGPPVAQVRGLEVRYAGVTALQGLDQDVRAGQITAVMGRNGAGKSTLLGALCGLVKPNRGTVRIAGADGPERTDGLFVDPRALVGSALLHHVGLVPQQPSDLLYGETAAQECAQSDRESGSPAGLTAQLFQSIAPGAELERHPRDLSEGQRLALALAVVLSGRPRLVLLDEPTRGLDYPAKARLARTLRELAAAGLAIVLATHDVELAAECSDRTVVLAQGQLIADGPSRDVVTHSPVFAPQVAKILAPLPMLTIADVRLALGAPR